MNRHTICGIFLSITLFCAFISPTYGTPVNGYNSYINILPGGKYMQAENFTVIDMAQKEVANLEIKRRGREINFIKPVNVEELTPKYLMIAFEVSFRPAGNSRFSPTPAIYALLFEQKASERITEYTSQYLKWLNSSDIEEYKSANKTLFCELFRHLGVDDCLEAVETNGIRPKKIESNNAFTQISGHQIVSGMVNAKYIDPEIARKKDLDAAVSSLSKETQAIKQSLRNKGAGTAPAPNAVLLLQNQLAEEKKMRVALEQRIAHLETLLKNVSIKNEEFLIEGLNVHIVNGRDDTYNSGNGKGNLILGYIKNSANEHEISEIINKISHKIITSEDEKTGEGEHQTLYPDGSGNQPEDGSIVNFLVK